MAPGPDPSQWLPDTAGLVDDTHPGSVAYRLPLMPSPVGDNAALVLAMDDVEEHLSRLRFALFLQSVASQLPENVVAVALNPPAPGRKHWLARIQMEPGVGHPFQLPSSSLLLAIQGAAYPEDPGFVQLATEHLGGQEVFHTRRGLATLAWSTWPDHLRAQANQAHLDQVLPAPRPPNPTHRM